MLRGCLDFSRRAASGQFWFTLRYPDYDRDAIDPGYYAPINRGQALHILPCLNQNLLAFASALKLNQPPSERFSIALNLNPTEIKNNPKTKELLF